VNEPRNQTEAIIGAILGCAVGDALGLPYEGLSRRHGTRLYGQPTRHRFCFGRGMVSDDTEHTVMVAQALTRNPTDPDAFARSLGWRFRWWLLCLPAGIGKATLQAILKLWLGFSPRSSGVFSAGNGPAMRSAILGAAIDDPDQLKKFVSASTGLTHRDPKAFEGAYTVALAAWAARRNVTSRDEFFQIFRDHSGEMSEEFRGLMSQVESSLQRRESTPQFALSCGCERGISGYVYRTVPMVIHAWLSNPNDYRTAISELICCGGDTDTTAAIAGGIIGCGTGLESIPSEWRSGLIEFPKTKSWLQRLGKRLSTAIEKQERGRTCETLPLLPLIRNLFFLLVVLGHVIRRALPPY
jgi:ADP-ribosylglycohydrolase